MAHYFVLDGNWGSAKDILIIDTTKWTEEMFDAISSQSDNWIYETAEHFDEGIHYFDEADGTCNICELTSEQLTPNTEV